MVSDAPAQLRAAKALLASGPSEQTLAAYESIIQELQGASDIASRELTARTRIFKGYALRALGRTAEELASYDVVLAAPHGGSEALREAGLRALLSKATVFETLGRREEELELLDLVEEREHRAVELRIRRFVGFARRNRAMVLHNLDRLDDALAAYDLVLRCYGDDTGQAFRRLVVEGRTWRPVVLRALERSAEALRAYDDLIETLGTPREAPARVTAASARLEKARYLADLGRLDDARAAFAALADVAPDLTSDELVAIALYAGAREAEMLEQLGRPEEALSRLRLVLERFSGARGAAALAQTASILEHYAVALAAADRLDEAIAAHDRLLVLLSALAAPTSRGREAASSVERACLLLTHGDAEAGAEALRSVFARFLADAEDDIQRLCAFAGVRAMHELGELDRKAEAIELAHAVYARFDGTADADIRDSLGYITTAFRQDGRSMRLVRRPPRS
jgi:tetratricopeptide (TPR) repeat protein